MLHPVFTDTHHVSSRFNTQLKQDALVQMLEQYQDRTLFHLVLTYKPFQDRTYTEQSVNKFFTKFYLRYFLPYLLGTKNYHRDSSRSFQPICLAFVDEHESLPIISSSHEYAARLHHHAILAVHHVHLERMNELIGTNTLVGKFSYKIMTSFVRPCSADTLKYASKMLMKYPDFLSFPDRLNTK
jgi:hypothetical protein